MNDRPATNRLASRLAEEMRARELGLRQAAALIGVSHSTVLTWLEGTSYPARARVIRGVAAFLKESEEAIEAWSPSARPDADRRNVPAPLLEDVRLEGGAPVGRMDFGTWYEIEAEDERDHTFRTFIVTGDCMAPRIESGDRAIVDLTRADSWKAGDLVAVIHDDALLVKQVERRNARVVLTATDGTVIHPNGDTRVIGVVVEIRKRA